MQTAVNPKAAAAAIVRSRLYDIADDWAHSVRKRIPMSERLETFVLYNFFPKILEEIGEALELSLEESLLLHKTSTAEEHGRERARLTTFDIDQIAIEYHCMRNSIFKVLSQHMPIDDEIRLVVETRLDISLQKSISGFAHAESRIREHFIAMLAHDIRSPLAFMRMALHLLRTNDDPDEREALVSRMGMAVESALGLIENILDANAIRASQKLSMIPEKLDLLALIEDVIRGAHGNIRLNGVPCTGIWSAKGIRRVIQNLVDNAVKYGDLERPVSVMMDYENDAIKIAIHNFGPPIPVDEQLRIFQIFRRATATDASPEKGWGFGLPIVREIIEAHGGTVVVESRIDEGTTFTISLPLDARPYMRH